MAEDDAFHWSHTSITGMAVVLGALVLNAAAARILPARSKDCHIGLCKELDAPGQIVQRLCCRAEIIKEGFQRSHIFTQQSLCLADRGGAFLK